MSCAWCDRIGVLMRMNECGRSDVRAIPSPRRRPRCGTIASVATRAHAHAHTKLASANRQETTRTRLFLTTSAQHLPNHCQHGASQLLASALPTRRVHTTLARRIDERRVTCLHREHSRAACGNARRRARAREAHALQWTRAATLWAGRDQAVAHGAMVPDGLEHDGRRARAPSRWIF